MRGRGDIGDLRPLGCFEALVYRFLVASAGGLSLRLIVAEDLTLHGAWTNASQQCMHPVGCLLAAGRRAASCLNAIL